MYDVLILAMEQQILNEDGFKFANIRIDTLNRDPFTRHKFYAEIWPYINNANGIMYQIYIDDQYGKFKCGDGLFQYDCSAVPDRSEFTYLHRVHVEQDGHAGMKLRNEYTSDFRRMITSMLNQSPIHTIMFLCRGQSRDEEIVIGVLKMKSFLTCLEKGEIFTNICYVISQ